SAGYRNLCALISESRLTHPKGEAGLRWERLAEAGEGLFLILPEPAEHTPMAPLAEAFPRRFFVGVKRTFGICDAVQEEKARALSKALNVPLCAHNDVHTHRRGRQSLQDVLTAIREGTPLAQCGRKLFQNSERTLKGPEEMRALFADLPEALE